MCQSFPTETSIHCCLELLSSPRAVHSSVQSLLVLSVTMHFGSGKSSAAPAWLSKGAPQLQQGRLSHCLEPHAWQGTVDFPGSQPAWPPQEACLSLNQPSCHKCATLQLLESALLDQSLDLLPLHSFNCCPFKGRAENWLGERGSGLKGWCSSLCPAPFQGPPKLQALKEGRLGSFKFHRITEPVRLERTSEMIKSNL